MKNLRSLACRALLGLAAVTAFAVEPLSPAASLPVGTAIEHGQPLTVGWEYYQGSLGSPWEVWRESIASDNVPWTPVTLPHCFNARDAADPDVRYYQGPGWYRTRLKLANPYPGGRTMLHFNGAGQRTEVYIGLEKVAEHLGGYDEWSVDLTEAAAHAALDPKNKAGIPLAVRCDNSRDAESIPSDLSDFNRYGGLYRHVLLSYLPAVALERVHVAPSLEATGNARVDVRARLLYPPVHAAPVELTLELRDPAGALLHTATQTIPSWSGEQSLASITLTTPVRWSPASPALYRCAVTLRTDQGAQRIETRFGVRSVEWVEHGPFKLNGERLLLRGTHYHEDHAGVAAAVPDAVVRKTLQAIKAMGANFVRLGHHQQAPLVLELCDELGLLVWEEIPWCRGGLGGERYREQARAMLGNLIDQHFHHPSVILWGLGNENDWPGDFPEFDQNAIRAFMTELNTLAHRLDPSRQTSIRRCDFCKDIVDVYSPSIWAGWYGGRYTEYRASTEKAIADTAHFFHAEYGGDSHAGRHSEDPEKFLAAVATGEGTAEVGKAYLATGGKARASRDGDWSESYMVNLFDWHLKEQEQLPNLTGAAQWIFKDFSTPLRPENPVPRVNQKGVVERDGTPKESYYVFQSYWSDQPMVHIYGHTWPTRWGRAGEKKQIKVFSNCPEVELFLAGVSLGRRQRVSADFPAAGLRWDVALQAGANHLRAVGYRDGQQFVDEISVAYQTATWTAPARLTLKEIGRTNGQITLEAQAYDAKGVPCLDAANLVRFGLTGDGRLIDNLGTARGSRAVQLANGRAQISLQLTGPEAVASLASEGLPTTFLHVTTKSP